MRTQKGWKNTGLSFDSIILGKLEPGLIAFGDASDADLEIVRLQDSYNFDIINWPKVNAASTLLKV